jgi:hypothetical protein
MNLPDITKFSWGEAFSNSQGKTSIALISGFVIIVSGCLGFILSGTLLLILISIKDKIPEEIQGLTNQSVIVIGIGAGLYSARWGLNKVKKKEPETTETPQ